MSDHTIAQLAAKAASHPLLIEAVSQAVRSALPAVINAVLRENWQGETLHLHVAQQSGAEKRVRNEAIKADVAAGVPQREVAARYRVRERTVRWIVANK